MLTFVSESKYVKRDMSLEELSDSLDNMVGNSAGKGIVKILNKKYGDVKCKNHPDFNLTITLNPSFSSDGDSSFEFISGPICCTKFKDEVESILRNIEIS